LRRVRRRRGMGEVGEGKEVGRVGVHDERRRRRRRWESRKREKVEMERGG
jgi:hypothetical protein